MYQDARSIDFKIPDGRYYLADAGYPNIDALLAPYWGMQYHLKEWESSRDRCNHVLFHVILLNVFRPQNHQELFNLQHARLKNVIECIFGILKRCFRVLQWAQKPLQCFSVLEWLRCSACESENDA